MDQLLAIFLIIGFPIFIYYGAKKDISKRKKEKEKEKNRKKIFTETLAKAHQEVEQKENLIKEKENKRQQLEALRIKGEQLQKKEDAAKAAKKQLFTKQKNAIENIDKEIVINWHKEALNICTNYKKEHAKFLEDYKDSKKSPVLLSKYNSYNFETHYDNSKSNWSDSYPGKKLELYLVKLRNTIDGKLYLVAGIAHTYPVEKVFIEDPVVEFIEVVNNCELNTNLTELLFDCMLHHFKPEGDFDPFSKFNGYEGVIELRFSSQASEMIEYFKKNQKNIYYAMGFFMKMNYNKAVESFSTYDLNNKDGFNEFHVTRLAKWHKQDGVLKFIRKGDFLNSLYVLYESNASLLHSKKSFFESELSQMLQSYPHWMTQQISDMKLYVNDKRAGKVLGESEDIDDEGNQILEYKKNAPDQHTRWRNSLYFENDHPLSIYFDIDKPIQILSGWINKNSFSKHRMER
jgi:hypothetical protein